MGDKNYQHDRRPVVLQVEVVRGDVTRVSAPVMVVGHYQGVAPVSAEGAIDRALNYWITRAGQQAMIGAGLGELFFIPVTRKQIAAQTVLLAGMGEAGNFTRDDLRYLMSNVTSAISRLKLDHFASVLIGSGKGNLSKEEALFFMLEGINDAFQRLPDRSRIRKLILAEYDRDTCDRIIKSLKSISRERPIPGLDVKLIRRRRAPLGSRYEAKRPPDIPDAALPGLRMTVERNQDRFRFSALSETAVVPVRELAVQASIAGRDSDRLMSSSTLKEQIEYGQSLADCLMPQDFRKLLIGIESLTLILDRSTASFPWEMICFKGRKREAFFGPDLKLTRQFRTRLASPGLPPPLNRSLNIMVIADPAAEPELQLPGARREGQEVVRLLLSFKKRRGLDLHVVDRIGASACDPDEILRLLSGEEFDIVHFAGHGIFDEMNPNASGWVFGRNRVLSAQEIFKVRRVPRLVFANACFSAVIQERRAMTADETHRHLAGLAEAFFARGIQNYIGTGWSVDDLSATAFASVFYQQILSGADLGAALSKARRQIMDCGSSWGAYQHYGQVHGKLVVGNHTH